MLKRRLEDKSVIPLLQELYIGGTMELFIYSPSKKFEIVNIINKYDNYYNDNHGFTVVDKEMERHIAFDINDYIDLKTKICYIFAAAKPGVKSGLVVKLTPNKNKLRKEKLEQCSII